MKHYFCTFIFFVVIGLQLFAYDGIFKKIVLINEYGKRTVVNPESIIGFKHVNVNNGKNWFTTVLELDDKGELIESKYRSSAVQISQKAKMVNVNFINLHNGQFYNPKYFQNADAFVTNTSYYFKGVPNKGEVEKINSTASKIKGRSGKIIIKTMFGIKELVI